MIQRKQHQKINDSIKEINSMMFKLERIVNQNAKLKTEADVNSANIEIYPKEIR